MDSQPPTTPTAPAPDPSNSNGYESNWPKRTAKACSNCRRDKTRCDGARPCSGCTKKALQCTDGCDPCRRARARCEKTSGDSCVRCDAKELICTEDSSAVQTASLHANPIPTERVKTACQNCRNDNKKCDNQRPCSRCVARGENCIPLTPAPRTKQTKTRCEGCRKRNVRCEDARPCQNCVTAGTECVNLARKGPGLGTRVKAACTNCRKNKVRCDGARPCSGCSRRGLQCHEQVCKRCAEDGSEECTHRARLNEPPGSNEAIPSTSSANAEFAPTQPSTSATRNPISEPSMFAPLSAPLPQPTNPPGSSSNALPVVTSSAESTRA